MPRTSSGRVATASSRRALRGADPPAARGTLALSSFRTSDVVEARVSARTRPAPGVSAQLPGAGVDRIAGRRWTAWTTPARPWRSARLDTEFHVRLADAGDNQLVADVTARGPRRRARCAAGGPFRARDDWSGTAARLAPSTGRSTTRCSGGRSRVRRRDAVERHIRGCLAVRAERPRQPCQHPRIAGLDHRQRLLGDLQLLVRRHHEHRHRAAVRRHRRGSSRERAVLRASSSSHAEQPEARAHPRPDVGVVLADPRGEHHRVQPRPAPPRRRRPCTGSGSRTPPAPRPRRRPRRRRGRAPRAGRSTRPGPSSRSPC